MKPEYNISGGVRGKYYEQYWAKELGFPVSVSTSANTASYNNVIYRAQEAGRNWLPPGSRKSWRRGIWQ